MKKPDESLKPLAHAAQNRCFGCGPVNPTGLHLEFMLAEDGRVVCNATIPDVFEGPKGFVHGGIIATLLDEIMSKAVRSHGVVGMTRHLEVDYLRPIPSSAEIRIEGWLTHGEGRKHWAHARIVDENGRVLAEGKGLFVEVSERRGRAEVPLEANPHN